MGWEQIAFAALAALDLLTTVIGIRRGFTEANPVLRRIMRLSPALWPAIKAAASVAVVIYAPPAVLIGLSAVYAVVVVNNLRVLSR